MTTNGCIPISSNCVIWQGPKIPCLNLCKGDSITEVLYKFATDYCALLEQLDPTKYDLTCLNNVNCPPESFQELIQAIIDKICDIEQQQGPVGPPGQDGADGTNGNYVTATNLPSGNPFCPCGGTKLDLYSGSTNTLINQYYACNGCDGTPGVQGPSGPTGAQGPAGIAGATGVAGPAGSAGTNGKSGRGVAVFVQNTEPDSTDFNTLYGSVEGFGVNYITGNNQIKAGDLWIESCGGGV